MDKICSPQINSTTFKIPSLRTMYADKNVAATPMKAHNPLKPPMIDGFKPEESE